MNKGVCFICIGILLLVFAGVALFTETNSFPYFNGGWQNVLFVILVPAVSGFAISKIDNVPVNIVLAGVAVAMASTCILTYRLYFPLAFTAKTAATKSCFSCALRSFTFLRTPT